MIKLIASDMDGTLLNSELTISEINHQAILFAQAKGIEFMVATGRSRQEALPILEDAGITCAMITLNGAQVFDRTGQSILTAPIDYQTGIRILNLLDEYNIYYEVATETGVYTTSLERRIENFAAYIAESMPHLTFKMAIAMASAKLNFSPVEVKKDLKHYMDSNRIPFLKIIAFHNEGGSVLERVVQQLHEFQELAITSSGHNNIEINHKNAQKGIAVASMAKQREISLSDVMTIGDNLNDLSMIQEAGVSFAMGNAIKKIKEAAKYQADSNTNHGVGKAIMQAIDERLE